MAMKDSANNLAGIVCVDPQAATADVTGDVVDVNGYEEVTVFGIGDGTFVGTIKLQESATSGGTYTDVAAADIIGTQDSAIDTTTLVQKLGYIGSLGYIKAVITHTTNGDVAAVAVAGSAKISPVS